MDTQRRDPAFADHTAVVKAIFMDMEMLKEIQVALAEEAEMLPPLALAAAR